MALNPKPTNIISVIGLKLSVHLLVGAADVADGASIARSLLAELPGQLLEYMKSRGIVPGNRPLVQPHAFAS